MENFRSIGAYWYSRPENLKACAENFHQFLINLEVHNPLYFGLWFETSSNKKKAQSKRVIPSYINVKNIICKKCEETDLPKTSFSIFLWNGKENEQEVSSISASLGSDEQTYFSNCCFISLPFKSENNEFYNNSLKHQAELIQLINSHWNPKWLEINGKKCKNF